MKIVRRKLTPEEALIVFGKGLLLLVLVPWAAWAALDEVAEHRLGRSLDELNAAGFSTCLEQLAPSPVPAEENAALYYSAAFEAIKYIDRASEDDADDFVSAEPDQRAKIGETLKRSTEVLALLRHARTLPRCRFDRDYRKEFNVPIPEYPSATRLATLLALRAQVQADGGHHDDARETVRDLLSLADRYRDEPDLHLQLLRCQLVNRVVLTIGDCSRSAVTEADLLAWMELLPAPSTLDEALERGLRADVASTACLLTKTRKLEILRREKIELSRVFDPLETLLGLKSLDRMRQAVELCGRPYAEARPVAAALEDPVVVGEWNFNVLRFLERPITRLLDRRAIHQSALALMRAGLEAELYFVRHGHYPTETTVRDEITGEPFVIDLGEGVIRASGPGAMDPETLKHENLVWTLER